MLFQAGATFDTSNVLQVANSVGAESLSVDTTNTDTGLNLAVNGGAEVAGTFATNWTAHAGSGGSPTITQDTTSAEVASGTDSVKVAAAAGNGTNAGVNNNLGAALAVSTSYVVSFSVKSSTAWANSDIAVEYYRTSTGPTLDSTCSSFTSATNPTINTSTFIKYSCVFTTTSTAGAATAFLAIRQTTAATRNFFIDNLAIVAENATGAQDVGDLKVGGATSQGLTLLTVDSFAGAPFAAGATINSSLLGSIYYDTTVGKLQCYEAKGWGSCGNSPNNSAFLIPEYPNAVLGAASGVAAGIGTMTASVCSGSGRLNVNTTLCTGSTDDYNYYAWTSPQATSQTYSIYVRYQLPATYNGFLNANTIQLVGRTTSTTDGSVVYSLYSASGSTSCGTSAALGTTTVTTSNNTWQQVSLAADETSGTADCTFAANDIITFRVDLAAKNNATVYASNLTFTTKGL